LRIGDAERQPSVWHPFRRQAQSPRRLSSSFRGIARCAYGHAEHFVDEAADTGISKWFLTGTDLDGNKVEVRGCDFYTFRLGKVIRKGSYWKIVERA
jgi:hypothetical protein